ncbi:alpha-amylase family glycosyl hydrolase [Chitinivibrio alkaliphilus]|uniref:Amylosucrase n=1 Tax=Chitinivibrio alkaliphilus ACht1 TaxID=1313304 RepID=U7DCK6_9BACT|nr:alpha-amylase family glycosyl hydrolase [Chitinivibrio alkaliphilus]ERP32175.1 amylosucrase [Chitinivibrio alkaliphilus ACht1]
MNELTKNSDTDTYHEHARITLRRLMPVFERQLSNTEEEVRETFLERVSTHWPRLFSLLFQLYGHRYDFFYHLEQLAIELSQTYLERPQRLKERDKQREYDPTWFMSNEIVGGAMYVGLFTENLQSLRENISYFKELGITYVHLMPLFEEREGESDGGYAIKDYRSVNPELGTLDDLREVAQAFQEQGILLVLDFVFNHTSDEHLWAKKAQSGDPEFQDFYYIFPDRTIPNQYEEHLREIFPTVRRGNFSWHNGMKKWVWTTFNSYQWDLKYANPSVFRAMLGEMFFLANVGVDVLRLDAVAFIWKKMGTNCENLPEAHLLIQAFNAAVRIATPGLIFKSEAIVHPRDVLSYVSPEECHLSYNPLLMAMLWEALATRKVHLLHESVSRKFSIPQNTMWCNYLRCHDDIGWTFDNDDAWRIGIDPEGHRDFLNRFYTGDFEGSFARGVPFQYNPDTGDMRISGTLASLAGLEQAIDAEDGLLQDMAIKRIVLLNSLIMSMGGVPLLYLGEEWGVLNDYDYIHDPRKSEDSRWIHRSTMRWDYIEGLDMEDSLQGRIYRHIQRLIHLRKEHTAFFGAAIDVFYSGNEHVFAFIRNNMGAQIVVLANFSEEPQEVSGNVIRSHAIGRFFYDIFTEEEISTAKPIPLGPYQFRWLERR